MDNREEQELAGAEAVTKLCVFVVAMGIAGLLTGLMVKWITGSEWLAQVSGYIIAGVVWIIYEKKENLRG